MDHNEEAYATDDKDDQSENLERQDDEAHSVRTKTQTLNGKEDAIQL